MNVDFSRISLILVLVTGLFWFGTAEKSHEPAAVVGMTNQLTFTPDTVRIQVGETIRWKNSSLLVHSVTADPAQETKDSSVILPDDAVPFNSGLLDPEETFEYSFKVPGTYKYFCIPHEAMMTGVVIVEPR